MNSFDLTDHSNLIDFRMISVIVFYHERYFLSRTYHHNSYMGLKENLLASQISLTVIV